MREIKFRGKRIDDGKWVYGSLILYGDGASYITTPESSNNHDSLLNIRVVPETVGQLTGNKDKLGNVIYEGDIINFHYFFGDVGESMGFVEREAELKGVVYFASFGWGVKDIVGEHWRRHTGYDDMEGSCNFLELYALNESSIHDESFEIIGNIHDNPELLS